MEDDSAFFGPGSSGCAHYSSASHIPLVLRLSAQDVPSYSVRGEHELLAQLCEVQGSPGRNGGGVS